MCGIAGFYAFEKGGARLHRKKIDNALKKISHRGPDDSGINISDYAALGHVRLSIIDLSDAGKQPMNSHSGLNIITYNGEVYNYKELKNELSRDSLVFFSNSDTEIVIEHFERYGLDSFKSLNGMFAFSIFNKTNNKAYLVRDRFGVKPLYYKVDKNGLYFASEIKALNVLSDNCDIEENSFPEWSYFGCTFEDRTFYKDIKQVLPGHFIEIDLNLKKFESIRYWAPEDLNYSSGEPVKSIIKKTYDLLSSSVKRHLVSDVPVGVFLSGGLDSSIITAFASQHYNSSLDTFTAAFDFELGDGELSRALEVSKMFNTNHHEFRISGFDIIDTIQTLVECHDNPFSDAANIPLLLLSKELKGKTKVVLQGDGGDEIFGGYRRYRTLAKLPFRRTLATILAFFIQLVPFVVSGYDRKMRYLNALRQKDDAFLMALLLTVETLDFCPTQIFSREIQSKFRDIDPFHAYKNCAQRFSNLDIVQKMLYTDTQLILPNVFLEKVDRPTMAFGIEARVPMLDYELTDYVMGLPSNIKVKNGEQKWLLKNVAKSILPNHIINYPKTGFGVPYEYWIKGPLKDFLNDTLLTLKRQKPYLLDWKFLTRTIELNNTGFKEKSFLIWKSLNLMLWLLDNDSV